MVLLLFVKVTTHPQNIDIWSNIIAAPVRLTFASASGKNQTEEKIIKMTIIYLAEP